MDNLSAFRTFRLFQCCHESRMFGERVARSGKSILGESPESVGNPVPCLLNQPAENSRWLHAQTVSFSRKIFELCRMSTGILSINANL